MSDAPASLANTLSDRYTIERLLGHGGMATVHLAEEIKHKRKVAIKILKQEFGASVGAERFLREIGIAARLSHPHIVPLIDSGESDGSLYYVSPYVPGGSLRDRLNRERRLPIDDALRIANEVGAALDYAHRNGFVHRDVKPENILFADDHALLADFGIAHVASASSDEPLTLGGLALGTPEYMSPEQAAGESDIGVPGDVYGLACVFYEMLAGEPPFKGASPRATMAKQVTEKARPLRTLRPDAPAGFEKVLVKALAKDPAQRFATIVDFCDALSRAKMEPNRPFVMTTRTIATTLRSTSSFAALAPTTPKPHTENVQAYGLYLRGRYAWNKRTSEGVYEGIRYFEEAIALDPTYALAYTGLADSYSLHIDYRNVPVHEGHQKAKFYARKAIALDDSLAEAHASLAWSLFIYDWRWEEAAKEFRRAIELDPRYAAAHQWYAFQLASEGHFDEALIEAHMAQENDPASVSVRRSLGYTYVYARKLDQARYHLDRAIAMNPTAEESYRLQGMVLTFQKQYEAAERVLREGLTVAPECANTTRATLAYSLALAGDKSYAERLVGEFEERLKTDYVSPVDLAVANIGFGNKQRALDWVERAIDERRGWAAYLRVHPVVDSLRDEPRFNELVKRMAFDAPAAPPVIGVEPSFTANA